MDGMGGFRITAENVANDASTLTHAKLDWTLIHSKHVDLGIGAEFSQFTVKDRELVRSKNRLGIPLTLEKGYNINSICAKIGLRL